MDQRKVQLMFFLSLAVVAFCWNPDGPLGHAGTPSFRRPQRVCTMRFEEFEPRIVFDQSLGSAADVGIDTTVDVVPEQPPQVPRPQLPNDIQFRDTDDDFVYSSEEIDPAFIDQLAATTDVWSDSPEPIRKLQFSDSEVWLKTINTYPPHIHGDGYIVAERFENYPNSHTLLVANKLNSDDFALGGAYSKQDYHYQISFDVRHPKSELSWLTDHKWALVMQMWGPREAGETARNPPLSIYSVSNNGVPSWIVRNLGDSRRITQTGEFEQEHRTPPIPMENIGGWNHWDIEYVPNPDGKGVVRAWLNGKLVADWVDIKSNYYSVYNGVEVGPFNPAFGLYSHMAEDGMEAHFDNIVLESNGQFESSIAGHVTGTADLEDNTVFATNVATGKRYGTLTGSAGVYTLAVPKGVYSLTAVNKDTGHQVTVGNVDTRQKTKIVDVDVSDVPPPAPAPQPTPSLLTLTGDVNGDGNSDVINRLADGSWQVTVVRDAETSVAPVSRGTRDPGAAEPPETSLADLGLSARDVGLVDMVNSHRMVGHSDSRLYWRWPTRYCRASRRRQLVGRRIDRRVLPESALGTVDTRNPMAGRPGGRLQRRRIGRYRRAGCVECVLVGCDFHRVELREFILRAVDRGGSVAGRVGGRLQRRRIE